MRKLIVAPCLVFIAVQALALSPPVALQRIPPIGWETRITPGFDPPIEYQVVYEASPFSAMPTQPGREKEIVASWGPSAFGVLKKMYEDPAWDAYDERILTIMEQIQSDDAVAFFTETARTALAQSTDRNIVSEHLGRLKRIAPAEFDVLFDSIFATAIPQNRLLLVQTVAYSLSNDKNPETTIGKLQKILAESPEPQIKNTIQQTIEYYLSQKRADEPMQNILDIEREKEPQP